MLVRNQMETGNAAYAKQTQSVQTSSAHERKDILDERKAQEPQQAAELTLSARTKQIAEENALSAESAMFDVSKAEEMIRQANQNILNQADDAVKVQSGQSVAVAIELLK